VRDAEKSIGNWDDITEFPSTAKNRLLLGNNKIILVLLVKISSNGDMEKNDVKRRELEI